MPYTPPDIRAPRLAGLSLRAFSAAVATPGLGGIIRSQMLAQLGVPRFRAFPAGEDSFERAPWPVPSPSGDAPDAEALARTPHAQSGFRFPSIADYADAYRAGSTDPVAVAQALVDARTRADASSEPLRAFIAMDTADLLRQAEESARRLASGEARSVLEGVPIAVKDELDQLPYPTTVGTAFLGKKPAIQDATVVARLREAGALLVGKTNMHELGIGVTGINPHHGAARNPYALGHVTGGSSSGSAAAAAAGFCPVAIGADGGGSIRIPSAFCGMVGLKPSFGRVSEHGAAPLCWSVAHVGPIGANVRDVAAVYAIIAGADPADPGSLNQPAPRVANGGVAGLRIGVDPAYFAAADPEVVAACERMVAGLVAEGAVRVDIELPDPEMIRLAHIVVIVTEMAAARLGDPADARFGIDTGLSFALARGLHASDYVHALRLRRSLGFELRALYERVDVVVTPTAGCTAPPILPDALETGESNIPLLNTIMRFATPGNLFGLPAISVPAGYDAAGLPIGFQAMARPWEEDVLFRIGFAAEGMVERRKPAAWFGVLD